MDETETEKTTIMSSFFEHSIKFHVLMLSFIHQRREVTDVSILGAIVQQ